MMKILSLELLYLTPHSLNFLSNFKNAIRLLDDTLLKMQEDSKKESAIESKRFIIQTVLSVASLIVAAIAAVASIIALL